PPSMPTASGTAASASPRNRSKMRTPPTPGIEKCLGVVSWFPSSSLGTYFFWPGSAWQGLRGRKLSAYYQMLPKQSLGQNFRSQAGAWERENGAPQLGRGSPRPYPG